MHNPNQPTHVGAELRFLGDFRYNSLCVILYIVFYLNIILKKYL